MGNDFFDSGDEVIWVGNENKHTTLEYKKIFNFDV